MSLAHDPILRDEALVLRWYPVTDSSRIVVWFTRHHGRVSTLIKGAQRPKSWTLGQFDLFYTCELLFYRHAREDLHHFKECSPLRRRRALRQNWRGCAAASCIADLLYRVTPPAAISETLYDLSSRALDRCAQPDIAPALLFWYELHLLQELGLAPDLGDTLHPQARFAYEEGRVLPADRVRSPHAAALSGGVWALLRRLSAETDPAALSRIRILPEQTREIALHLERFATWHLDHPIPSRALALDLMLR